MKVCIVGGGIGGLTAAGLLSRSGHDVVVLEQTAAFGQVGAGIQISPNASRVLAAMGLGDALDAIGTQAPRIVFRRWDDDRELMSNQAGPAFVERYGHPYLNVYRPDLLEVLVTALDDVDVRFGSSVVDVDVAGSVTIEDGSVVAADVVIGADGIKSTVASRVFGPQSTRFSGWVAYRALIPSGAIPGEPVEISNRLGPDQHLVSYFVGRGQRYLNLVCVVRDPEWDVESWNEPGDLASLRRAFADWSPRLQRLLDAVDRPVYRWALHDREPMSSWIDGRVALLGDACHPMVPFMAQGACMAIEDAAVLDRCLAHVESPREALSMYERARLPRASSLQRRSWDNCTTYHLSDGPAQVERDEFFEALSGGGSAVLAVFDEIYGYDPFATPLA